MRSAALERLLDAAFWFRSVERLGRAEREPDLVEPGRDQPLVPALVQREPGVDDARPRSSAATTSSAPGHLRHAPRVDEARDLDRRKSGIHEPARRARRVPREPGRPARSAGRRAARRRRASRSGRPPRGHLTALDAVLWSRGRDDRRRHRRLRRFAGGAALGGRGGGSPRGAGGRGPRLVLHPARRDRRPRDDPDAAGRPPWSARRRAQRGARPSSTTRSRTRSRTAAARGRAAPRRGRPRARPSSRRRRTRSSSSSAPAVAAGLTSALLGSVSGHVSTTRRAPWWS